MNNLDLEFDYKILNIFNFLLNLKKAIITVDKIKPEKKRSLLSEFEESLLNNMKILSYKAFGKNSSIGKHYSGLMRDLKQLHKKSIRSSVSKIKPIVAQVWENFEDKLKPLLNYANSNQNQGVRRKLELA